jgi:hypothetical protein
MLLSIHFVVIVNICYAIKAYYKLLKYFFELLKQFAMQNKELVISLIQQDLKHHQLIIGLENISLNAGRKAGALIRL